MAGDPLFRILDENARKRIEQAVIEAEKRTSAEIVPVLVLRSSAVGHVAPLAGFFLCTLGLLVQPLVSMHAAYSLTVVVVSLLAGWGLSFLPAVQRLLTPRENRLRQVEMRAHLEFFSIGVHRTRKDTGVLIFVSWMERRVVILAGDAVSSQVPAETWEKARDALLAGIRRRDVAGGFADAIALCADALAEVLPATSGDADELPNAPVVKD